MGFIDDMMALATYHDKPICHTRITGNGDRFHGFRRVKWSKAAPILKQHQKVVAFSTKANGVLELETRDMIDSRASTGVMAPRELDEDPYKLVPKSGTVDAGAVTRRRYAWDASVATDSVLHRLVQHPSVLDVWVEGNATLSVFEMHNRNIEGGLVEQHQAGKGRQKCRRHSRSPALRTSSAWKPLSRAMKHTCSKTRGS